MFRVSGHPVLALASLALLASTALGSACAESHGGHGDDAGAPSVRECRACDGDAACIRGVCVSLCGLDAAALESELGADLTPVAHVCTTMPPGPIGAHAVDGTSLAVVHAHAELVSDAVAITVQRHVVTLPAARIAPVGPACATTFRFTPAEVTVEISSTLGLSPAGAFPHFGLIARSAVAGDYSHEDVAYVLEEDGCVFHARPMTLYGGTTMLTEDPRELIVQGRVDPLGDGLFRGDVWLAMPRVPGGVARFRGGVITPAEPIGHGAFFYGWFPGDALRDGPFPVAGVPMSYDSPALDGWPREMIALQDRALVGRSGSDLELHPARLEDDELVLDEAQFFASPRFTHVAAVEGSDRVVLLHAGGVLVVEL